MDHLAILDKKRNLLSKIISGEKKIESRWYKSKIIPWDAINAGETIYFKDSGQPVTVKATVSEVRQFYLPQTNILEILEKYGQDICFSMTNLPELAEWCKQRKYCILIHLKDVEKVIPFQIDKKGFGLMAAWITVSDIKKIKVEDSFCRC